MDLVYDIIESWLREEHESYPSFGLFIRDTGAEPIIFMHFGMTQQCCVYSPIYAEFRSEGADEFRLAGCLKWREVDDDTRIDVGEPGDLFEE